MAIRIFLSQKCGSLKNRIGQAFVSAGTTIVPQTALRHALID
jgi:hypothetical protein